MARKTKAETQQTRRDIIDAARRVFAQRGVSRTSLEQIAAEAGVTRGAVYWHFANKLELFMALRDDVAMPIMERLHEALQVEGARNPLGAIEACLMAHIERLAEDPATCQTFEIMIVKCEYTGELGEMLKCFGEKRSRLEGLFHEAYQRAAASGQLREGLDPAAMARDTYAFLIGLVRIWIGDSEHTGIRAQATDMIRSHVALRRAGGMPSPTPPRA